MAKSKVAKESLGLGQLFPMKNEDQEDILVNGLKQMNQMENKMKNIENNMDEIFEFYRNLGIELPKEGSNSQAKKGKII